MMGFKIFWHVLNGDPNDGPQIIYNTLRGDPLDGLRKF